MGSLLTFTRGNDKPSPALPALVRQEYIILESHVASDGLNPFFEDNDYAYWDSNPTYVVVRTTKAVTIGMVRWVGKVNSTQSSKVSIQLMTNHGLHNGIPVDKYQRVDDQNFIEYGVQGGSFVRISPDCPRTEYGDDATGIFVPNKQGDAGTGPKVLFRFSESCPRALMERIFQYSHSPDVPLNSEFDATLERIKKAHAQRDPKPFRQLVNDVIEKFWDKNKRDMREQIQDALVGLMDDLDQEEWEDEGYTTYEDSLVSTISVIQID